MSTKNEPPQSTKPAPKKSAFKQPLSKPQPWRFGGRGPRDTHAGGVKARADAERLAGKSRKVH
ncbi:hypothetical protein [Sinimarinibacterium thermocellulolyticum]|uniref:Uncharacterized protein n=1 Tax=Sinimarinibacterium thermocellulolyticum TaxID=3170016 RepID=A0ABV2AEJ0_9GAMM